MPNDTPVLLSAEDFASKVKAKYPDYATIPDQELTAKIIQKYPEYSSKVMAPGVAQSKAEVRKPIEQHQESTFVPTHGYGGGGLPVTGKPEEVEQVREAKRGIAETGAASAATAGLGSAPGVLGWIMRGLASGGAAGATHAASKASETGSPDLPGAAKTGAIFGATEMGGEAAIKGAGKVISKLKPILKEVAKGPVTRAAEKHAAEAAEVETAYQKELTAHKENVQAIKAEHQQATTEFQDAGKMKEHQQNLAGTVKENIQLADKRISQKLGDEFQKVNEAVEKKAPVVKVQNVEQEARGKLFFPDSVGAFNNIMESLGTNIKSSEFGRLRMSYSQMNDILYGGKELPPDLYKALKTVRDGLGKDLQAAAKSVGEGERYTKAMKDWADYKDDWHDTSSIAKGGSPIKRILQSEDPQYVIDQLQGKAGQRLIEDLSKYGKYGADSGLAKRLQDFSARIKATPMPKAAPEAPKIPAPPAKPATQSFDREAVKRRVIAELIRKSLLTGGGIAGGELLYHGLFGDKSKSPPIP